MKSDGHTSFKIILIDGTPRTSSHGIRNKLHEPAQPTLKPPPNVHAPPYHGNISWDERKFKKPPYTVPWYEACAEDAVQMLPGYGLRADIKLINSCQD